MMRELALYDSMLTRVTCSTREETGVLLPYLSSTRRKDSIQSARNSQKLDLCAANLYRMHMPALDLAKICFYIYR